MQDVPGRLLIFDNAEDFKDIEPWLPNVPAAGTPGHGVITTRRGGYLELGSVLDLARSNVSGCSSSSVDSSALSCSVYDRPLAAR
jgi:hypothetical protein